MQIYQNVNKKYKHWGVLHFKIQTFIMVHPYTFSWVFSRCAVQVKAPQVIFLPCDPIYLIDRNWRAEASDPLYIYLVFLPLQFCSITEWAIIVWYHWLVCLCVLVWSWGWWLWEGFCPLCQLGRPNPQRLSVMCSARVSNRSASRDTSRQGNMDDRRVNMTCI